MNCGFTNNKTSHISAWKKPQEFATRIGENPSIHRNRFDLFPLNKGFPLLLTTKPTKLNIASLPRPFTHTKERTVTPQNDASLPSTKQVNFYQLSH
ncbi:hypothetical protein Zmor_023427 [Zophobas morio]|uniref:Uncharacterized protein n=1 Tax=Zophobas morio TaxID=2755281 RepID=A0AA38HXT5_9CUCU|nr:hypothetical protein Zmor_023427 [Zophobas morio]